MGKKYKPKVQLPKSADKPIITAPVRREPIKVTGGMDILNVGHGDINLTFNNHNDAEVAKARHMITDMMQRGYTILVQLDDKTYVRATEFDAAKCRYVIEVPDGVAMPEGAEPAKAKRGRPSKSTGTVVSVPVAQSRSVGIARSAGG